MSKSSSDEPGKAPEPYGSEPSEDEAQLSESLLDPASGLGAARSRTRSRVLAASWASYGISSILIRLRLLVRYLCSGTMAIERL